MHEGPYWTHRRARRMARTVCFTVVSLTVCLAAGVAVGIATGERGTVNPGLPRGEQPGDGALLVGGGVALLVGCAMRIAYVLHERRRKPSKTYRIRYERGLTAQQYVRRLACFTLVPAGLCGLGLWLRHQYG